jgi:general secretion pathway protein F
MAGEESGRLREMLLALCVYQKKQEEVARKVRGALTYPLFMLAVGVGTVFFVLTFVMPKLTVLFEGMRQGLPWPTRCVMAMSHAVRVAWPILAGIVFIGALAARFIFRTPEVRRRCGYFLAVIPWIRAVVLKVDLERFARTLGLLLESGIPLLKALEIAVPVIQDEALRRDMVLCQERVASGSSFGECLAESRNVPDLAVELIMVAEESGALSGALNDIAATYEDEINELTRAVTTLIEPLLVVIVGLVVGFIVFAMLMPIFQMDMFVS